jgi:hypothetical protein
VTAASPPKRITPTRFRIERLTTSRARRAPEAPPPHDDVDLGPPTPRSLASLADDLDAVGVQVADEGLLGLVPDFERWDREFLELVDRGERYAAAGQGAFCPADASTLFAAIAHHRPAHIIEVGVGHSTGLMLDAIEQQGLDTAYLGVDTHIGHLFPLLHAADLGRHAVHRGSATDCPPDWFARLQAGDLLFVDSSHQCGPGSDVDFLIDEVVATLPDGVLVHFHDIYFEPVGRTWFHPDEVARGFDEPKALGRYLGAPDCRDEVTYFGHLAHAHAPDEVAAVRDVRALGGTLGGSIWFTKRA